MLHIKTSIGNGVLYFSVTRQRTTRAGVPPPEATGEEGATGETTEEEERELPTDRLLRGNVLN